MADPLSKSLEDIIKENKGSKKGAKKGTELKKKIKKPARPTKVKNSGVQVMQIYNSCF